MPQNRNTSPLAQVTLGHMQVILGYSGETWRRSCRVSGQERRRKWATRLLPLDDTWLGDHLSLVLALMGAKGDGE